MAAAAITAYGNFVTMQSSSYGVHHGFREPVQRHPEALRKSTSELPAFQRGENALRIIHTVGARQRRGRNNSRSPKLDIRGIQKQGAPDEFFSSRKAQYDPLKSVGENVRIPLNLERSVRNSWPVVKDALESYFEEVGRGWETIWRDQNPAAELERVLAKEWKIIYLMTCNDFAAAVLHFWCMGINVLAMSYFHSDSNVLINEIQNHGFWVQTLTTMSREVLYSFLYLYSFNLANQYVGAPGDAIDKPWRPIPAGLLTKEGALARCVLVNSFFAFVSWHLGVLHFTLLCLFCVVGQFTGQLEKEKSSQGLGRSFVIWIQAIVLYSVGVLMVTPMNPALQWWAVTRGAMTANHHWMQDFRDVEGDMKIGRTTFPIMFGLENARKIIAVLFLMDPVFMHFVVLKDSSYSTPQLIGEAGVALLSAALIIRVTCFTTSEEDHETWTTWMSLFWHNYTFLVVGPALLLGL